MADTQSWQYYWHTFSLFNSGLLVMLGVFGLSFMQAGMVRSKNVASILSKNFLMFSVVILVYFFIGQQLMYGSGASEKFIIHLMNRALHIKQTLAPITNYHPLAATFFQLFLPCLGLSIIASTTAERLKLWSFIFFSVLFSSLIYPIIGACHWGQGFLYKMGFIDYNGAGIVFLLSAVAALVGSVYVGPRSDKFKGKHKINPLPASNIPLVLLGAAFFWLGSIGFNTGVHVSGETPLALDKFMQTAMNCCCVGACSLLSCAIITRLTYGAMDITLAINGLMCGLVAISANPANATMEMSLLIGAVSGTLTLPALVVTEKCRIDDPMGIATACLVGSLWGLCIAPFVNSQHFVWSWMWQLLLEACGAMLIITWGIAASILCWTLVKFIVGLRIEDHVELRGLDVYDCALEAYPEFTHSRE